MAKAVCALADVSCPDGWANFTVVTVFLPMSGETFAATRAEIPVKLVGTETPQQINTAINTAVQNKATALGFPALAATDISSPKFS